MSPWSLGIVLGSGVLSFLGTGRVLQMALRQGVLDHPSERSSHSQPTPRGGGLAFVAVHLAALLCLTWLGAVTGREGSVLLVGGVLVAGLGWADDRRGLAPGFRLAGLGPRILRAETAAVAACTLVQHLYGDLRLVAYADEGRSRDDGDSE